MTFRTRFWFAEKGADASADAAALQEKSTSQLVGFESNSMDAL